MKDVFQIRAGDIDIPNPIALSPMAGITDADYALENAQNAGLVILGSYNLDEISIEAAKETVLRNRKEFIFEKPLDAIGNEIKKYRENEEGNAALAVSVRGLSIEKLVEAANFFKEKNVIMELDVHCRQPEFTERGLGQGHLRNIDLLKEIVTEIKKTGVVLSVKFRSTVAPPEIVALFFDSLWADIIHIDAMIDGGGPDINAIKSVRNVTKKLIIANNSVTEFSVAKEFFTNGADIVSVARGTKDKNLITTLVNRITERQIDTGWYNSPSHICRGGDNRGLAFCCPPVKNCRLLYKLEEVGLSPEEFINIKASAVKGTLLEYGDSTCFGSLAWCCKASKPCYIRDGTLKQLNLSKPEYSKLKKQMSEKIVDKIFEKGLEAA